MRAALIATALAALALSPSAWSGHDYERTHGPCFNVVVQNERVNAAQVRQRCDFNFSRTVQVGERNHVETQQSGLHNDNAVRQYRSRSFRSGGRPH